MNWSKVFDKVFDVLSDMVSSTQESGAKLVADKEGEFSKKVKTLPTNVIQDRLKQLESKQNNTPAEKRFMDIMRQELSRR